MSIETIDTSTVEHIIQALSEPPAPAAEVVTLNRPMAERILAWLEDHPAIAGIALSTCEEVSVLRQALAEPKVELWAIHSVGPDEVYPCLSKEHAEREAKELFEQGEKMKADRIARGESVEHWHDWVTNVIPSPWEPAEHFEILAGEIADHRKDLIARLEELEKKAEPAPAQTEQQPVEVMLFQLKHPDTGDAHTVALTRPDIADGMDDSLFEKLGDLICDCQPVGETNVVDCSCDDYIYEFELANAAPVAQTTPQHFDDRAIDRFAAAMKTKMAAARAKGRDGWFDRIKCPEKRLARMLIEHLSKGNEGTFEDVANFCMMLHQRGEDPQVLAEAAEAPIKKARGEALELGVRALESKIAPQPEQSGLVTALEYYANGDHLLLANPDEWDTCSGEPANFLHDEAGTASVEDGSIAKVALEAYRTALSAQGGE